jgi:uncharacterized delta-60 repeat protein
MNMKVSFKLRRLATFALPATCWALAASTTACGDDDAAMEESSAGSSGSAGRGGSGGGKGGSDNVGGDTDQGGDGGTVSGGTGGTGGNAGTATGGTGGTGTVPSEGGAGGEPVIPGEGGAGGEGPAPMPFHSSKVNGPNGTLVPQVNDLRGVTFASNGKIWAVGHIGANTAYPGGVDRQIAVVRFDADGQLDPTFDGDGIKSWNLRTRVGLDDAVTNDGDEYCMGVKELPSGDLVIQCNVRDATGKGRDVVLLKMSQSGSLINWTGAVGAVRKVDFGWTEAQSATFPGAPTAQPVDESWGIDLTPDGKSIVVFGHGPAKVGELTTGEAPTQRVDNDRYVTRVNVSDGAFDATFNGGAVFTFNTGGTNSDGSRRGYVEADGTIVSSGYTSISQKNNIFVARLSASGVPDAKFTSGPLQIPGVFQANPFLADNGFAECYAAKKQSSGRYVTTGYGTALDPADGMSEYGWLPSTAVDLVSFGLVPGDEGGVLDETFGVDGTLAVQSEAYNLGSTEDRGRDLVVLPDDRVVFAGRFGTSPALMVITEDGELDASEGGKLAGANGSDAFPGVYLYKPLSDSTSHFFAIAASKDGKRVAATTNNHADGALLAVLNVE